MQELQIREGVDVANGLNNYETVSGKGWDMVASANHGQGAWRKMQTSLYSHFYIYAYARFNRRN
jgi:hypothetical protein